MSDLKSCKWNFIEKFNLKTTLQFSLQFSVEQYTPASTEDRTKKQKMLDRMKSLKKHEAYETHKQSFVDNWNEK